MPLLSRVPPLVGLLLHVLFAQVSEYVYVSAQVLEYGYWNVLEYGYWNMTNGIRLCQVLEYDCWNTAIGIWLLEYGYACGYSSAVD